jgi:hypothetical protein
MREDQVLGASGRAHRIGLDEAQAHNGAHQAAPGKRRAIGLMLAFGFLVQRPVGPLDVGPSQTQ